MSCLKPLHMLQHQEAALFLTDFNMNANRAPIIKMKVVSVCVRLSSQVSMECVVDSSKCEKRDSDKRVWGETQCEVLGVSRKEVREESVNGPVQLVCVCVWGRRQDGENPALL